MRTQAIVGRPEAGEHAPHHNRYISLIQEPDVLSVLERQIGVTLAALKSVPESFEDFRYADGKWSVKEVIGHMSDTERVFAYRALRIARNDQTPLPGFEQDDYIRWGNFQNCRLPDLIEEFATIRKTTLSLFRGLGQDAWSRRGIVDNNQVSVRAIAFIIAGHESHHQTILQEKYLRSQQSIA